MADYLQAMLEIEGHYVERIDIPYVEEPDLLFRQLFAYRWMDLSSADRAICLQVPSHLISHPEKVVWFSSHVRALYPLTSLPDWGQGQVEYRGISDALRAADTAALNEARHVFAMSRVASNRLRSLNGVGSEVLYLPPLYPERLEGRGYNDEIVCVSPMRRQERQHLLVEAMQHCRTPTRLRLCGVIDDREYWETLKGLVSRLGLDGRVIVDSHSVNDGAIEYLVDCLAAACLPLDGDSLGYVRVEPCQASKPILSAKDCGAVLEFVRDGFSGLVTEPTPEALSKAIDILYADRPLVRVMGTNAYALLESLEVSWRHVLDRLLS